MKKLSLLLITACFMNMAVAEEISYHPTPLQAVFADNTLIEQEELSSVAITQTLSQVESPSDITITVIESDLLDDSIRAIKIVYALQKAEQGWAITSKATTQQCRRGEQTEEFTENLCP